MINEEEILERIRGLERAELRAWVRQGWVVPARRRNAYVFREIDVARVRLIYEMRTDLALDEEGIPVVLSLLDQIYGLRRELKCLARAVEQQPEEVRAQILDCLRRERS